jgi:DNA-binding NarL/FixJ family response regulator
MSEAERRHGDHFNCAPSRVRQRRSALLAVASQSTGPAKVRPIVSHDRFRVLMIGEATALLCSLARELAQSGIVTDFAITPDPGALENARRTLVFVDLGTPNQRNTASLLSWRERLPDAVWIVLADGLEGHTVARLLAAGVTSIPKPITATALAELAQSLTQQTEPCPPSTVRSYTRADELTPALHSYSGLRALSGQQRLILGLYLGGSNDKAIAERCGCSEATVYEHWRRMAKKAGGTHKADAINDFHRFLAGN